MISHVTILKFRPDTPAQGLAAWRESLSQLPEHIPALRSISHGPDLGIVVGQSSADYTIIAEFENSEDVKDYYVHPSHRALTEFSFPNSELIISVDYESTALRP